MYILLIENVNNLKRERNIMYYAFEFYRHIKYQLLQQIKHNYHLMQVEIFDKRFKNIYYD